MSASRRAMYLQIAAGCCFVVAGLFAASTRSGSGRTLTIVGYTVAAGVFFLNGFLYYKRSKQRDS